MSNALDDLNHEHRVIERVVEVLERATTRLEHNQRVPIEILTDAVEFITGFADGCHHFKEEDVLFPVMANKSPQIKTGPVKVLLAEHDVGRHFVAQLKSAIASLEAGQAEGAPAAAKALAGYTQLLRKHISKEDQIFFPLASALLTGEELEHIAEQFEEVEQEKMGPGAHERFETIAERMEALLPAEA